MEKSRFYQVQASLDEKFEVWHLESRLRSEKHPTRCLHGSGLTLLSQPWSLLSDMK